MAGGLSKEAVLQQQEVMTDESLSDEYECASPDDMSLPSLSATPESNFVQSDADDSPVHQYVFQSEPSGSSAQYLSKKCQRIGIKIIYIEPK